MLKLIAGFMLALALAMPAAAGCKGGCTGERIPDSATSWSGDVKAPSRLIVANPSHAYGGPVWIAIEFDIARDWFIFASASDEAAGPRLEWRGSHNLAPPVLRWPPPLKKQRAGGTADIYKGYVTLPISVAPLDPGADVEIDLTLSYAVCGEVCRPVTVVHRIVLSAAPVEVPVASTRHAARIAEVLATLPP